MRGNHAVLGVTTTVVQHQHADGGADCAEAARLPAAGQEYDFSGDGGLPAPAVPAASIEVASAEALRILQRHYGTTSSWEKRSHQSRNWHGEVLGRGDAEDSGAHMPSQRSLSWVSQSLMDQSVRFALVTPLLVLGPWLDRVIGALIRAFASNMGPAQSTIPAAISYEQSLAATASLRIGGLIVTGGLAALLFKLFLMAPCIRYGGVLLGLPPFRPHVEPGAAPPAGAASDIDAERGEVPQRTGAAVE